MSTADDVRAQLLALPLADRVKKLIDEAGNFIHPISGRVHQFLPGRPDPENAPGGFHTSEDGESWPIAAPEAQAAQAAVAPEPAPAHESAPPPEPPAEGQ